MNGGTVVALHVNPGRHRAMEPREAVMATERGVEGDVHAGRRGKRQVLLVDAGDLHAVGLAPGDLREQVTVDLPGLMGLRPAARLTLGEAEVEITGVCEPCTHIGDHVGVEDPEAFRRRLIGRRGMLARVVREGRIAVGDRVAVAAPLGRSPVG